MLAKELNYFDFNERLKLPHFGFDILLMQNSQSKTKRRSSSFLVGFRRFTNLTGVPNLLVSPKISTNQIRSGQICDE